MSPRTGVVVSTTGNTGDLRRSILSLRFTRSSGKIARQRQRPSRRPNSSLFRTTMSSSDTTTYWQCDQHCRSSISSDNSRGATVVSSGGTVYPHFSSRTKLSRSQLQLLRCGPFTTPFSYRRPKHTELQWKQVTNTISASLFGRIDNHHDKSRFNLWEASHSLIRPLCTTIERGESD